MADPVSITSLVLEIGHVVSSLIRYAKDLRGARSEPRKLTEELFALKGILEHLHPSAQQFEEKKPPPPPYRPNTALDPSTLDNVLRSTSEFLHTLLTELEEPETRFKGLKQRLEWPFTQKEFNAHLTRLERVKSWLILGMVADNAALDRDLYREMENLASCMKEDLYLRGQERMKSANRDLVGWLAPVEPGNAHLKASKRTEIGTGRWFIDGYFKDWLRGDEDAVKIVFLMGKCMSGSNALGVTG